MEKMATKIFVIFFYLPSRTYVVLIYFLFGCFSYVFFLIAWSCFFALLYKAAHVETDHIEWDPYGVLGLDRVSICSKNFG